MSYFDSLSSWQQAGNAIQQQQEDAEKEQREQKAQGIEQKFDYVDKVLGEAGGGLGGLGGGFHIGVRMYRKGQKKVADAKKAFDEAKAKLNGGGQKPEADGEGSKTPNEHTSKPNGQEDQPPEGKPKFEAGESEQGEASLGESASDAQAPAPAEVKQVSEKPQLDDIAEDPNEGMPSEQVKEPPEPPSEPKPSDGSEDFPEAPKPPEPKVELGEEPDLLPKPGTSGLNDGVSEMKSSDGSLRIGQQPNAESITKEPNTTASTEGSSEITTSGADEAGTVVDDLASKTGSIVDKVKGTIGNISDKVSDLKSTVTDGAGDMLKAGAEKIAGQAGKDALESASGVLDFLGPIGELLGAGLALGSFFHDLFDKKKMEKKQQEAESTGQIAIPSAGGISTTSMTVASEKSCWHYCLIYNFLYLIIIF